MWDPAVNSTAQVSHVIQIHRPALSLEAMTEIAIQTVVSLIEDGHSIVMTLSSGKDSTTTTILCLEAIRRCANRGIKQATHFISSSRTGVENPAIEELLLAAHENITRWSEEHNLPVEVHLVEPHAAAKFVVATIGRGTLPRFVENGSELSCSSDWKVNPQQRLAKALSNKALSVGRKETISDIGKRFDVSSVRGSSMLKRGDQGITPNRDPSGFLTLSLIADWREADVLDFLVQFVDGCEPPFSAYVAGDTVRRMLVIYRDGNSGTCGMFMADGKKAPCDSRFGCFTCTVGGDKDRSMETMLETDEKYAYLRGLNNFRNYLIATQWDMSTRELVGRTISDAGYLAVRPDVYDLSMRQRLLAYLLTLDELERERAEGLEADIVTGKVPRTPENLRMSVPQFEHVTEKDIILIDFMWGLHHYAQWGFPALQLWYEIKQLGRRYKAPSLKKAPKGEGIAEVRWFEVGAFDKDVPTDGLRSYAAIMWNRYRHPQRQLPHMESNGKRVVWHEEVDTLQVSAEKSVELIDRYCTSSFDILSCSETAPETTRFLTNEGIVIIPSGMIGRYQYMAQRAQYFTYLYEKLNLTPAELDEYLLNNSITNAEHAALVGEASLIEEDQLSLFEL